MEPSKTQRIAVVTGANRGLGLEICRQLAKGGVRVVLTARDEQLGRQAAEKLAEQNLSASFHPLDVCDAQSVERFQQFSKDSLKRVDILVNNAGIFIDKTSSALDADLERVRQTFETNVLGAWRLSQALIPLMRGNGYGRIVNLSSGLGQLCTMEGGFGGYRVSKAALNALTRMLAAELVGTNILVNAVCPGWTRTDMGGPEAERSIKHGAQTPVWLASLADGGPTGLLFRDKEIIPW